MTSRGRDERLGETATARGRWFSLVLFSVGCSGLELPAAPDLTPIEEEYRKPDGTIDADEIAAAVEEAVREREDIEATERLSFVSDNVEEVVYAFSDYVGENEAALEITAVTDIKMLCPGSDEEKGDDGAFLYKVLFDHSVLKKTIWGEFSGCRAKLGDRVLEFDGTLEFGLPEDTPLKTLAEKGLDIGAKLFRIDGTLTRDGATRESNFDFRVLDSETFEVRALVKSGSVVFRYSDNTENVLLRARDKTYCCDFDGRYCALVETTDCSTFVSGTPELSW